MNLTLKGNVITIDKIKGLSMIGYIDMFNNINFCSPRNWTLVKDMYSDAMTVILTNTSYEGIFLLKVKFNYYFTFGFNHFDKNNREMKDYWVRVIATNPDIARDNFINGFTRHFMSKEDEFAFQYNDSNFDKSFFPLGEIMVIDGGEND